MPTLVRQRSSLISSPFLNIFFLRGYAATEARVARMSVRGYAPPETATPLRLRPAQVSRTWAAPRPGPRCAPVWEEQHLRSALARLDQERTPAASRPHFRWRASRPPGALQDHKTASFGAHKDQDPRKTNSPSFGGRFASTLRRPSSARAHLAFVSSGTHSARSARWKTNTSIARFAR